MSTTTTAISSITTAAISSTNAVMSSTTALPLLNTTTVYPSTTPLTLSINIDGLDFLNSYLVYPADVNDTTLIIGSIISFITGLLWVFVGEKFFKFIMLVWAFIFGYWIVVVICEAIGGVNEWVIFGVGIAVGLLCGGILCCLKKLATVIFGIFLGVIAGILMWLLVEAIATAVDGKIEDWGVWICVGIFALIGGISSAFLLDTFLRALTPIVGSFSIVTMLSYWIREGQNIDPSDKCDWVCGLAIGLFFFFILLGWFVQCEWYNNVCSCLFDSDDDDDPEKRKMVNADNNTNELVSV